MPGPVSMARTLRNGRGVPGETSMKKLPRGLRVVVLLFFVASGATGLVLEVEMTAAVRTTAQ